MESRALILCVEVGEIGSLSLIFISFPRSFLEKDFESLNSLRFLDLIVAYEEFSYIISYCCLSLSFTLD